MTPSFDIRPSRSPNIGSLCVFFTGSNGRSYPAFWTFDEGEAKTFVEIGSTYETVGLKTYLQLLDSYWQIRQFDKIDAIFQEIEDATLTKCRKTAKPLETSDSEFQARNQS